jgi:hypothetical protein
MRRSSGFSQSGVTRHGLECAKSHAGFRRTIRGDGYDTPRPRAERSQKSIQPSSIGDWAMESRLDIIRSFLFNRPGPSRRDVARVGASWAILAGKDAGGKGRKRDGIAFHYGRLSTRTAMARRACIVGMLSWTEYWSGASTLYVSTRHRQVHYEAVARDIIDCLPAGARSVLDYGCGEALCAHRVAEACTRLYLCDSAPALRDRLAARYAHRSDITVVSPDQFEALADGTIDLIVANSVVQYFSADELTRFLAISRIKLSEGGWLMLADLIPRRVGFLTDATELLKFARANGFLLPAAFGLVRTFFSSYGRARYRLGLLRFDEVEILDVLDRAGFVASRRRPNFGHNSQRMTVKARREEAAACASPPRPELREARSR